MDLDKSLDDSYNIIAALLHDVSNVHGDVFNIRSRRLTTEKVRSRLTAEGIGYLTKSLPRLCKAFDKALAGGTPLAASTLGFKPLCGSELPRFLGEFFSRVLKSDGTPLTEPCTCSIKVIRQVCTVFYKYELRYTDEQEQKVLASFERTESDLSTGAASFQELEAAVIRTNATRRKAVTVDSPTAEVAREAKCLLSDLFAFFDPTDIYPRHGPGAVATRQSPWGKYLWTNVSERISRVYPLDAFYFASLGHVVDRLESFKALTEVDLPARVILVPKDSRGPRLISCEPVDFQWIQQGLGNAISRHVEQHPLTRENVRFTDQEPNRGAALAGSYNGRYSTLDLNEASDRVSLDLVHLLFPEHLSGYLDACRSLSTELPDGRVLVLRKFAPMGSCLCFPILALTVWAILTAAAPDAYTRERVYVYGDDVIVPTAYAEDAINRLESFHLKVNRDKSCTKGFFRESCGMDAYKGVDVTPVKLKTVWSYKPSPSVYTSWIAYANSFWDRGYYVTYDLIVGMLRSVYGPIPGKDMHLACPSLNVVLESERPNKSRVNKSLQKLQWLVWDVKAPSVHKTLDGWSMLLRYYAESVGRPLEPEGLPDDDRHPERDFLNRLPLSESLALTVERRPFSVSQYTSRGTSLLVRRWR